MMVNMTGFHHFYSNIEARVQSQDYDRKWPLRKLEELHRDVCAFKYEVVKIFFPVRAAGLFTLIFHNLDHLIEIILRFGVHLRWMGRHTNSSAKVSKLHSVSRLHDVRSVCMGWCLLWIK